MLSKSQIINLIHKAFGRNEYPGDDYLLGSTDGSEPFEEVQPFIGHTNWADVPVDILDHHSGSLNFFSEAGYRFFLPAYLVADLKSQLERADPVFALVHGFSNLSVPHEIHGKEFIRKTGKDVFINPNRYGALTFEHYSRFRLSVFSREESRAIVKYLENKQEDSEQGFERDQIAAALDSFWYERAQFAPTSGEILDHLQAEKEYLEALMRNR